MFFQRLLDFIVKRGATSLALASAISLFAPTAESTSAASDGAAAHIIYIWFADGHSPPAPGICGAGTPPPYRCDFADSSEQCEEQILTELVKLYADFNVELVTSDPGPTPHFTIVVSGENAAWCRAESRPLTAQGLSPVNCAAASEFGDTGYVFACEHDAARCARRIAHEQAHLVGLDHAESAADIMYPFETASGTFRDRSYRTLAPRCGKTTQNSHRLMMDRLGPSRRHRP